MLIIILTTNLPTWLIKAGYNFLLAVLVTVCIMSLLYYKKEFSLKLLRPMIDRLPQNISRRIVLLFMTFSDGLKIISNPKRIVCTAILSLLIWLFSAIAIYSIYFLQNIQLPLVSAFMVLVSTAIGVSIPTAPGFLGNFQFACILALSIFGIPKSDALSFSIVYYCLAIGLNILLGLVFLPFVEISFKDIKQKFRL
jgi:uncharacterized protein (TIRG00374 family)